MIYIFYERLVESQNDCHSVLYLRKVVLMEKKRSYILGTLTMCLIVSNTLVLGLLVKEKLKVNNYLKESFKNSLISTHYTMNELEEVFLASNDQSEKLMILDSKSKNLLDIESSMLYLRFLDGEYNYNVDHLARYIDTLSEKDSISENEIETLKALVELSKEIDETPLFKKEKGLFFTFEYPSDEIIALLKRIEDLADGIKH